MLVAINIVIINFMPRATLPPGVTVTLGSHVPIYIAMFISPWAALAVAIGAVLGFVIAGTPLDVWLRAGTHMIWVVPFAVIFSRRYGIRRPFDQLQTAPVSFWMQILLFGLALNVLHGLLEVMAILLMLGLGYNSIGWILLSVGGVAGLHGMIDFVLAVGIYAGIRPMLVRAVRG